MPGCYRLAVSLLLLTAAPVAAKAPRVAIPDRPPDQEAAAVWLRGGAPVRGQLWREGDAYIVAGARGVRRIPIARTLFVVVPRAGEELPREAPRRVDLGEATIHPLGGEALHGRVWCEGDLYPTNFIERSP
ncbi:MAG: hypothetical protein HY320_02125 [Armatimonadetes bacterium]|nr:hypothetical protein [Armatimonadota bacterium]